MKNPLEVLTPAGKIVLLLILLGGVFAVYHFWNPSFFEQTPTTIDQELEDGMTTIQKINDFQYLGEKISVEGVVLHLTSVEGFGDVGFIGDEKSALFFRGEYNSLDFSAGDYVKLEGTPGIFGATPWTEEKVFLQLTVEQGQLIIKNKGITSPGRGTASEVSLENRGKRLLFENQKPSSISERNGAYIVDFGDYRAIFTTEVYDNPSVDDTYQIQGFVYVLDEPYLRALEVNKT